MSFKRVILALACVGLLAPVLHAQKVSTEAAALEPEPAARPKGPLELRVQVSQKLSLDQALELAVQRNPLLLVTRLQVEQSKSRVREVEALLYPTLTLSSAYSYSESAQTKFSQAVAAQNASSAAPLIIPTLPNIPPAAETIIPGLTGYLNGLNDFLVGLAQSSTSGNSSAFFSVDTSSVTGSVQMNWTLFNFGASQAQIESTQQDLRNAELEFARQSQEIKIQVIRDYYSLQQQNSNVEIAESAVRNAEASLKDAQSQEKAGVGTRFDSLRSEVQVTNAQQSLVGNRSQREVARRELARLLNFNTPTDVEVEPVAKAGAWDLSLEESIFRALNDRIELAQLSAQEASAQALAQASRASLLPSLAVNASYNAYNDLNFGGVGFRDGYSVGATLHWSIYDGGAASARAEQSRRNAQIARVRYTDTSNTIRENVEANYLTLQSSREQIDTSKKGQNLAEESLRLARLRFRNGVGTQTDVIAAEDALTQAKVNLIQSTISYNRSLAELRRALNLL